MSLKIQDVEFPSITICNLNQLEADNLKQLNVYGDMQKTNALLKEFITGYQGNLTQEEEDTIKLVKDSRAHQLDLDKWSFDVWSSQKCKYLFVNSHFQGRHHFTWRNISKYSEEFEGYGLGPSIFLTDYGACCTLIPHLDFETKDKNKSLSSIYHELKADSKSGDNFGLDIVLNAEDFNYGAYHQANGAGFKIALHHHLDKPLMKFSSDLINPGTETQINLKPVISYTSKYLQSNFPPERRDCYIDGEANLTYLHYNDGYRYEMNNCLIDAGKKMIAEEL